MRFGVQPVSKSITNVAIIILPISGKSEVDTRNKTLVQYLREEGSIRLRPMAGYSQLFWLRIGVVTVW